MKRNWVQVLLIIGILLIVIFPLGLAGGKESSAGESLFSTFGQRSEEVSVLIVGMPPGKVGENSENVFFGEEGAELNEWLSWLPLDRTCTMVTYWVNRSGLEKGILELPNLKVIITLGDPALRGVLSDRAVPSVATYPCNGKTKFNGKEYPVLGICSPSYVLRKGADKSWFYKSHLNWLRNTLLKKAHPKGLLVI